MSWWAWLSVGAVVGVVVGVFVMALASIAKQSDERAEIAVQKHFDKRI